MVARLLKSKLRRSSEERQKKFTLEKFHAISERESIGLSLEFLTWQTIISIYLEVISLASLFHENFTIRDLQISNNNKIVHLPDI